MPDDTEPSTYNPALRSTQSRERAFLSVKNTTGRSVDVYWIDYSSRLIRYATLQPSKHVPLDTYCTHPWIFKDNLTGLLMHVNNQEVFWPQPFNPAHRARTVVLVHFPLQSLLTNTLWTITLCMRTESDIECLELPKHLVNDLQRLYRQWKNL